jgi:AcrR family transcriptional regulator
MYAYTYNVSSNSTSPRIDRRDRARRQPLRRADIVDAAIRESEAGRLGGMTMRGLATGLRVTPMALYAHVANKDEILDEVLDHALRSQPLPTHSEWKAWITGFARDLHEMLCANPALLDRYLRRPVGVPAAIVRMEAAIATLRAAGFDDSQCIDIYASVHACTVGFSALEVTRRTATSDSAAAAASGALEPALSAGSPGFWPAYFATLADGEFPHLARIRPDLADFASSAQFVHVIGDLLAGHQSRPTARRRRSVQEAT